MTQFHVADGISAHESGCYGVSPKAIVPPEFGLLEAAASEEETFDFLFVLSCGIPLLEISSSFVRTGNVSEEGTFER